MTDWLKNTPPNPSARLLLAHGAGAPMDSDFMNLMAVDKKNLDGQLRLILLRSLGEAEVTDSFAASDLASTLAELCH